MDEVSLQLALEAECFPLSPVELQAWGAARRVSKDDWLEWLRRLSLELLKDSSSPSLRSCWALAQAYNPMARYDVRAPPAQPQVGWRICIRKLHVRVVNSNRQS